MGNFCSGDEVDGDTEPGLEINDQLELLEQAFRHAQYLDVYTRELLKQRTGMSEVNIEAWFSNRRARLVFRVATYEKLFMVSIGENLSKEC